MIKSKSNKLSLFFSTSNHPSNKSSFQQIIISTNQTFNKSPFHQQILLKLCQRHLKKPKQVMYSTLQQNTKLTLIYKFIIIASSQEILRKRPFVSNDNSSTNEPPTKRRRIDSNHNLNHNSNHNSHHNSNHNSNDDSNHNSKPDSKTVITIKQEKTKNNMIALKDITQYHPSVFTIRGKFTFLSELQQKGATQKDYFYGIFIDKQLTEKKVNFWGEHAIKFKTKLKTNQIYEAYGLNPRKKETRWAYYGSIELAVGRNTKFEAQEIKENDQDDDLQILTQSWKFVCDIAHIKLEKEFAIIDVIGIIAEMDEPTKIFTKLNPETPIRRIVLADETAKIAVTLWDRQSTIPLKLHQIIALKKARVANYAGKSLNLAGHVELIPEHTRADDLYQWKLEQNTTLKSIFDSLKSMSNVTQATMEEHADAAEITIKQIVQMQQRFRATQRIPDKKMFKIQAMIHEINSQLFHYKHNEPSWALKITMRDQHGDWCKAICFETSGTKIMNGFSAKQAAELQLADTPKFTEILEDIKNAKQQRMFLVRLKENSFFQDRKKLDFVVDDVEDC